MKTQSHLPRVPRVIALACVLGVALVGVSDALNLYDRIVYWGKLVHAAEGFLVASVAAYLLIAYRDREQAGVHTRVVALMGMLIGVTFGAGSFWRSFSIGSVIRTFRNQIRTP